MTREQICKSMTLQEAIQVFRDTNAYGTMDIAKTVILEALERETKAGQWKSTIDGKPICSECGFVSESEDGYFVSHYCPNCGRKMER